VTGMIEVCLLDYDATLVYEKEKMNKEERKEISREI
jgi:hypothetical protein